MKRIRFERQAIKQTAGRRVVAIEKRAIGARDVAKCSSLPNPNSAPVCQQALQTLADEIAFMLRGSPLRFPRELFERVSL